jgi:hypothetical protein
MIGSVQRLSVSMRWIPLAIALLTAFTACRRPPAFTHAGNRDVPPVPDDLNLPETNVLVVESPIDSQVLYYRNIYAVAFDDTVQGATIRDLLRRYSAVIIGGADYIGPRGAYVIRVPDAGRSKAAVDSMAVRFQLEPGVAEATTLTYRGYARFRTHRSNDRAEPEVAWAGWIPRDMPPGN